MPSFQTAAIVLRAYDFSEADRVLVLLTQRCGKLRAVAKGVRRHSSRLAGCLEWLSLSEVQLYGRETRELFRVLQGRLQTSYPRLKTDLPALGQAARMAEILGELLPDRQQLPEIFALATASLSLLEGGLACTLVGMWFDISILALLGYGPDLRACQECGTAGARLAFHADAGGLLCRVCRPLGGVDLSAGSRRMLAQLLHCRPAWLPRLRVPRQIEHEITAMLAAALRQHLGRELKTETFRRAVTELEADQGVRAAGRHSL